MAETNSDGPRSLRKALRKHLVPEKLRPYSYQRLNENELRFLRIAHDGSKTGSPSRSILTGGVEEVQSCIAVSYVWGQSTRRVSIECDGRSLKLTENLSHALRALQCRYQAVNIWADAICINQEDDIEKARQLRLMGRIYGEAARVVIWLGQDEKMGTLAFDMVCRVAGAICTQKGVQIDSLPAREALTHLVEDVPASSFPAYDSSDWLPVRWLFDQPWFQRVWVIQEVSGNRNIDVMCGRSRIDWASVALVATWIEANDQRHFARPDSAFRGLRGVYNASFLFDTARSRDNAWLQLLSEARSFAATDPRDKIFGLLGHPSVDWGEDAGTQGLVADYSKTMTEVFADVVVRHIRQSRSLDILSQIDHGSSLDEPLDMASWIPRFDQKRWPSAFTQFDHLHLNACDDTFPDIQDSSPRRLALSGIVCGQIVSVSSAATLHSHEPETPYSNDPIVPFYLAHIDHEGRYPTGEPQDLALATTLAAGASATRSGAADTILHADFAAYMLPRLLRARGHLSSRTKQNLHASILRQQQLSDGGHAPRYADAVANALPFRRLCATREGYFGLGPAAMRAGDCVCVLDGGRVPFIVRASGEKWRLVGEVFVHGLMSGEAGQAVRAGRGGRRVFGFV